MMRAVQDGVDVINVSLGSVVSWTNNSPTQIMAEYLASQGVAVVASAGNDRTEGLFFAEGPAAGLATTAVGATCVPSPPRPSFPLRDLSLTRPHLLLAVTRSTGLPTTRRCATAARSPTCRRRRSTSRATRSCTSPRPTRPSPTMRAPPSRARRRRSRAGSSSCAEAAATLPSSSTSSPRPARASLPLLPFDAVRPPLTLSLFQTSTARSSSSTTAPTRSPCRSSTSARPVSRRWAACATRTACGCVHQLIPLVAPSSSLTSSFMRAAPRPLYVGAEGTTHRVSLQPARLGRRRRRHRRHCLVRTLSLSPSSAQMLTLCAPCRYYSSYGPTNDLTLYPSIAAPGTNILSTVAGGLGIMRGTSQSSPLVGASLFLLGLGCCGSSS